MEQSNREIMALLEKYGDDLKRAIKETKKLTHLYALSPLRENLLEWYAFRPEASLLQVGADYGALTGLFSRKTRQVTVLDEEQESLDVVKLRYRSARNISYIAGSLGQTDGSAAAFLEGQRFDYVTLIGSSKRLSDASFAAQIEEAKALLKPGGTLFVAACNQFGMKYFTGAKKDAISVTKKELECLLPAGTFYYPMPDYRVPSEIYSQSYLPKKGDLTKTLTLYDYPRYLSIDVGVYYDLACEDGKFEDFANSFLVVWSCKDEGEQA